ncbi:MAG TPA: class I SAM-dependent methyltransferase [Candidatus Kapabacteria bacterium]|nr:class I SAM-dependent methyltransferase [Candidatus Kapabacteria bacterium]
MWYQDWFADEHYLALYRHRNDAEAAMLLDLVERTVQPKKDARILDLACGAGRHSIAFAKRGYKNITGLDLSPTLIAKAKNTAEAEHVAINFIEGDMRSLSGTYDLILNLFTSFGYFESDTDNDTVIVRIGSSLVNSGYFVLDFFNAAYIKKTLKPHSTKDILTGERIDEFRELAGNRVNKKIIITTFDCTKEYHESVRLYTRDDLTAMIEREGMQISVICGSYAGGPFDEERSERCIIFAVKK